MKIIKKSPRQLMKNYLYGVFLMALLGANSLNAADIIITTSTGQKVLAANDTIIVKNGGEVTHAGHAIEGDSVSAEGGNTIIIESGGKAGSTLPDSSGIFVRGSKTDINVAGLAGGGPLEGGASNIINIHSGAVISNISRKGALRIGANNMVRVSGTVNTQGADCIEVAGNNNHIIVSGSLSTLLENSDGIWGGSVSNNQIDFSGTITTEGVVADGIDFSEGFNNVITASGLISTTGDSSDAFELGGDSILTHSGSVFTTGDETQGIFCYLGGNISHVSGEISATGTGSYAVKSGRDTAGTGESNLFHILRGASLKGGIHNDDANNNVTSYLTFGYARDNNNQADLTRQDDGFSITLNHSITSSSSGSWDGYLAGGTTTLNGAENKFNNIYIGGDSFQAQTLFGGSFTQTDIVNIAGASATLNIGQNVSAAGNVVIGENSTLGLALSDSSHGSLNAAGDLTIKTNAKIQGLGFISRDKSDLPVLTYGGNLTIGDIDKTDHDFYFDDSYIAGTAMLDISLRHSKTDDTIYMDVDVSGFNDKSIASHTSALTRALDSVDETGGSAGMLEMMAALQSCGTVTELNQAFTALSPVQKTATPTAVVASAQSLGDVISGHIGKVQTSVNARTTAGTIVKSDNSNVLMNLDPVSQRENGVWTPFFEAFKSWGDQDDKEDISGYGFKTIGFVLGTDYLICDSLLMGLSVSRMDTDVDSNDSLASTGNNTWQSNIYGSYFTDKFHVDAHAGYGFTQIDSRRMINFMNATAESDHDARYVNLGLGAGYIFAFDRGLGLEPLLEINYMRFNEDGYDETGAPGANLHLAETTIESFRSILGLRLSRRFGFKNGIIVIPELSYKWQHEFEDNPYAFSASFIGGGSSFKTTGITPDADHHILGLGIKAAMDKNMTININYEHDRADTFKSNSLLFSASVGF